MCGASRGLSMESPGCARRDDGQPGHSGAISSLGLQQTGLSLRGEEQPSSKQSSQQGASAAALALLSGAMQPPPRLLISIGWDPIVRLQIYRRWREGSCSSPKRIHSAAKYLAKGATRTLAMSLVTQDYRNMSGLHTQSASPVPFNQASNLTKPRLDQTLQHCPNTKPFRRPQLTCYCFRCYISLQQAAMPPLLSFAATCIGKLQARCLFQVVTLERSWPQWPSWVSLSTSYSMLEQT